MRLSCIVAASLLAAASPAFAQCWESSGTTSGVRFCNAVAQTAQVIQPTVGITAAGGNPIAGASSTLGMRLGKIPRVTLAARGTGVFMDIPDVLTTSSTGNNKSLGRSLNLDAAIGVLSGWSLAPTIGGFGSLDVIASAGKVSLSDDFTQSPGTWAVGARVGILRESFTAPGVSITGMYRHLGRYQYGPPGNPGGSAVTALEFTDNSIKSIRAVVGKRLFVIGANAGIGYDKFGSTVEVQANGEQPTFFHELTPSRKTVFANLTWTMLILNAVLEGGRMQGGDAFTSPLPSGQESRTDKSTYFASLAVRLAL